MALKQHKDDKLRFDQQVENSEAYVLPFIEETKAVIAGMNVLEIGCGEGGVLQPFVQRGCFCIGVDLAAPRIELARQFAEKEIAEGKMEFHYQNIYDDSFLHRFRGFFDIIMLKDVIEHVPEQEKFIPYLKNLLKPDGVIFFGFPPWYMPFGGHQQICEHKFTSKMPYYHILPKAVYKGILKMAGEPDGNIKELMEIKDTQITIERFERIVRRSHLKIYNKQPYLINPIYKYKFGLKPRKQVGLLYAIPYFRDFVTTCMYYTIGMK